MKRIPVMILSTLACAGCATHATQPGSRSIVVESPADLPSAGQSGGEDMFLHESTNGRTYLYIEADSGQRLSVLDVTDPAAIKSVSQVPLPAAGPFDYVQEMQPTGALVKYRQAGGLAVLDLSRHDHPSIDQTAPLAGAATAQSIGVTGLLLTSSGRPTPAPARPASTYDVLDTAHAGAPVLLASVPGVTRRLTKTDTGTEFLLAASGVTVVRNLRAEEAHALELTAAKQ